MDAFFSYVCNGNETANIGNTPILQSKCKATTNHVQGFQLPNHVICNTQRFPLPTWNQIS